MIKHSEKQLLQEIIQILDDLDAATYGKEKANSRFLPPDTRNFYCLAKRLYEVTDELVETFQPNYITESNYYFICDSQRLLLLELSVLKERNQLQGEQLTWELEKYLMKIQGQFECISSYCKGI